MNVRYWIVALLVTLSGCATDSRVTSGQADNPEVLLPKRPGTEPAVRKLESPVSRKSPFVAATVGSPSQPIPGILSADPRAEGADQDALRISVLNIGAGSCQIVECPGSDEVLIVDCGQMNPGPSDLSEEAIRSVFDAAIGGGNTKVVLSHPDTDHVNRIAAAMGDRIPQSVWLGGDPGDYGDPVATWLSELTEQGVTITSPEVNFNNRGKPVPGLACGDADTYMLTINIGTSRNAQSAMLLVEYGNFRAIFAGDAEGVTERAAMASFGALIHQSTVLLASHHGARTHQSNHQGWVGAVAPQIVVYSAGSSHGHPNVEVVKRYRESLFDTQPHPMRTAQSKSHPYQRIDSTKAEYVTSLNGTIIIESDGTNVWLECTLAGSCF